MTTYWPFWVVAPMLAALAFVYWMAIRRRSVRGGPPPRPSRREP